MNGPNWLTRAAIVFTACFSCVLVWAFLTPVAQLPKAPDISDYVWHISTFAILVIPLSTTLPTQSRKIGFAAILFGTVLECLQPNFGRGFQIHDIISNTIGVGTGWLISRRMTGYIQL